MLSWRDGNSGYRSMCGGRAVEGDIISGDGSWTAGYIVECIDIRLDQNIFVTQSTYIIDRLINSTPKYGLPRYPCQ